MGLNLKVAKFAHTFKGLSCTSGQAFCKRGLSGARYANEKHYAVKRKFGPSNPGPKSKVENGLRKEPVFCFALQDNGIPQCEEVFIRQNANIKHPLPLYFS